ncbi:putative RNA recognition motif domain, nucleotide-binding alpha-beta plait domain superfamily [Helianthus annuus]|nr:putative RNA recognition motif domain, nucleotide-binding alpha-beta plait domain superfamily [Helianthus annuus]
MQFAKTVKVSNLSLKASQRDVKEFFSFSGDLVYVEVQCNDNNSSQNAFVTFADSQGAETAVLLSGATIIDTTVTVTLAPEYHLPPEAAAALAVRNTLFKTVTIFISM